MTVWICLFWFEETETRPREFHPEFTRAFISEKLARDYANTMVLSSRRPGFLISDCRKLSIYTSL